MSTVTGQQVSDDGALTKYFSMMLHIDDDDLDPFEYKLLGHYRKQCGLSPTRICTEAIETTAKAAKMSITKARAARKSLAKKGCIKLKTIKGKTVHVTIKDRMDENLARYGRRDPYQIREDTPIKFDRTPLPDLIPIKEYKEEKKEESSGSPIGASLFSSNEGYTIHDPEPYVAPIAVK